MPFGRIEFMITGVSNRLGDQEPVFIYGGGSLARLLAASLQTSGQTDVRGFVVDEEFRNENVLLGLPVIGFEELVKNHRPADLNVLFSVGYRRMRARKSIFEKVKEAGFKCPNYLFPGARVNPEVEMGEGNILCDGVIIDSFTRVGNNNFFRSNTYVSHDNVIGDHNYFAPGCTLSGNCTVKNICFLGVGATVIDGLIVGDETFLSAGSTLLTDTEPHSQYIGYPAKKIRDHRETGIVVER